MLRFLHSFSQSCVTSSGRCALHRQRSSAASHAALAERPESTSICRIHVCRGLPQGRRHCRLLSGLRPVRASTARRKAVWAGTCSGSRRMWPNTAMRRLLIREMMMSSPVRFTTASLVTKSYQCIPRIRRWQNIWNVLIRLSSDCRNVHVSQP